MQPLPETMTYIDLPKPGGVEEMQVAKGALPELKPGEVLIRVDAAGVNRPDVAQRQGMYPPPPDASPVMGLEVAGEVVALGEGAEGCSIGDRVCALANGGGYAEYCAVPATQTLPWPKGYDAIRAAALPETFFTVWANLFQMAKLKKGERVLVHGGTSGIGTTAIQLAKAIGATVYTTAGSDEKCNACLKLGADYAINYKQSDFDKVIRHETDGRGVDVVLDMIGAAYFEQNIRSLAKDGRLSIIAFLGGAVAEKVNLVPIMVNRLHVMGSTMRPRTAEEKKAIRDELQELVWPLLENEAVAPLVHAVFPLEQVASAHTMMEESSHVGKIILTLEGINKPY